jgi:hypothetical protein
MATTVQNNIPHTTVQYEYDPFGSAFNVTVTCNTGFTIKGTPTMTVGGDAFSEVELTVAENKQSATGTIESETQDTTIELTGETESGSTPVEPVTPTVENNIPQTDYEAVFDESTSKYTVTVTCKTGYQFVGTPTVSITDDPFSDPVSLAVSSDKLTATGEIEVSSASDGLTLDGQTETIPVVADVTVTNNIADTTETHTFVNGTVSIKLTCSDTKKRYVGCKASYGDVSVDFPVTDSNDITVTLENVPTGANITLSGECRWVASVETDYLTGCKITGIKPWYVENETVSATLTANKGTYFKTVPQMDYASGNMVDNESYQFTVSKDKKTATISQKLEFSKESIELATISFVGSTVPEKVVTGYGSVNVYRVNDSSLILFSKARFQSSTGETSLAYDTDLGDYVNKLHKVFCDVGEVTETTIKCGNYDTLIKADSINNPVVTIDFGNVTLPVNNSDSSDFNATVKVFVPFKGFVAVDSDFIGKTLNLKYDVDLVTGDGCYKISVCDITISQDVVKVSSDVIYKTSKNMNLATIGSSGFSTDYLKGLKPFVVMKYYDPLKDRYNNDNSVKVLSAVTGFAKFKDITLPNIECLNSEYNEIVSLLSKGVIL